MKHCKHCGHTVVKVTGTAYWSPPAPHPDDLVWTTTWYHLVAGHLSVGTHDCATPEPRETDDEMSDPTDRMDA